MSPGADLLWFVAPGLVAAAWGLGLGLSDATEQERAGGGLGLWIFGVLLVDVAHVWASLYRTYFDRQARRLHRKRLIWAPLLCGWFGFLLHLESPQLFWRVLAYVAIFHFIKQHIGFALLYVRAGKESPLDRKLTSWAIWVGTAGPVLWWHAHLPRRFAWFLPGDLLSGLPEWAGDLALAAGLPIWVAFAARRIWLWRWGRPNPMVPLLAVVPALCWHLGIVAFDDDRIFTITNVFLHGVPYLALVYITGGRERVQTFLQRGSSPGRERTAPTARALVPVIATYYGLVVALAFSEELLWDWMVWHDHPMLFGSSDVDLSASALATSAAVAVLTVPQATHYLLDRWIWRVGPDNPRLAAQLRMS